MTWGIVSPTITQNAIMPPKALQEVSNQTSVPFTTHVQEPLRDGDGNKTGFPKAMLYRRLERVGAAKLRIDHDQTNGPVHDDCEPNEQDGTRKKTGVLKGVRLSDDAGAAARVSFVPLHHIPCCLT